MGAGRTRADILRMQFCVPFGFAVSNALRMVLGDFVGRPIFHTRRRAGPRGVVVGPSTQCHVRQRQLPRVAIRGRHGRRFRRDYLDLLDLRGAWDNTIGFPADSKAKLFDVPSHVDGIIWDAYSHLASACGAHQNKCSMICRSADDIGLQKY